MSGDVLLSAALVEARNQVKALEAEIMKLVFFKVALEKVEDITGIRLPRPWESDTDTSDTEKEHSNSEVTPDE